MPVFNLFFNIVKSKKISIIMYYGIFLVIFFIINAAEIGRPQGGTLFQETQVSLGFVDEDDTALSGGIENFLDTRHKLTFLKNDKKALQDTLYEMKVNNIIRIPKGFGDSFDSSQAGALDSILSPNDFSGGYLINQQLNDFLGNVKLYRASGLSMEEAVKKADALFDTVADLSFLGGEKTVTEAEMPGAYYYFRFLPYVALCVLLMCVCPVLVVYYQPDVYRRCVCSSMRLKSCNFQLTLAILCFTASVFLSLALIGYITQRKAIESGMVGYLGLNSLVFCLVATSLAYLCGFIAKTEVAVSGLSNVIGLGMCFLGGIFVSIDVMPEATLAFAKLLPTYWYTMANTAIFENAVIDGRKFFQSVGMQLLFAAAMFCIALVLSRRRQRFVEV